MPESRRQVVWVDQLASSAAIAVKPRQLARRRNRELFSPRTLRKGIFFSNLFPRALSRQGLFHSTSFAWLQVIRVTFHFSNDVFRLNFTFESAERIVYGFARLQSNFCHAAPLHQITAIQVPYKRRFVPSVCLSRGQSPPNLENTSYSAT